MNYKIILAGLIVLLVVGVAFFIRMQPQERVEAESETRITAGGQQNPATTTSTAKTVSVAELQAHDSESDCWISYEKKVYDITSYLPRHPGSAEKILPYCGSSTEFEQAFVKKHGTSKVGLLMKVGTFIGDFDVVGNTE